MVIITVIPSDLALDKRGFDTRLARLLPISREIHLDLMDGRFVVTKSVAPDDIPDLRRWKGKRFEAHLMMKEPLRYVIPLVDRGVRRIIVHREAIMTDDLADAAQFIRRHGASPVLAFNPETPLRGLRPLAKHYDGFLLMGVHPGHNGAPYVRTTPRRVKAAATQVRGTKAFLQVDGGMTPETVAAVVAAGATRIASGSFVGNAPDPAAALRQLRSAARKGIA